VVKKEIHESEIVCLRFFYKTNLFASGSSDYSLKIIEYPSLDLIYDFKDLDNSDIFAIDVSPNDDLIAICFFNGNIKILD
jgi:WD40 repeat protein